MNRTKKLVYDVLHNLREDLMVIGGGLDKESLEMFGKYMDYYRPKEPLKKEHETEQPEIMYQNYKSW